MKSGKRHQPSSKKLQTVLPPALARPEKLPLGDANINWEQFEAFSRDFVSKLEGVVDSKHYGTRGSKQKGIDLYADFTNAERRTYQCKQQRKFTLANARSALRKAKYRGPKGKRVTKKVILVSCEVDSTVRDFMDSQANWELWDIRDISKKVRELELGKSRSLVEQHFGTDWRKIFLGLAPVSPFLSPERFFGRFLKQDRLFNHAWKLVGRRDVLAELKRFSAAPALSVGILPGRGGIGKTKILHAFSEAFSKERPEKLLWFVQESVPLTPETLDELPLRPTIIVVDDAHRRDDLSLLFAHVARAEHRIQLLLATRVHGIDGIRSALSRNGYDVSETVVLPELKKLGREEVRALAKEALGPSLTHLADRLSHATKDCPLVTVVGGTLLAQRSVAPELLERDTEFQHAVLERFRDELLGNVCTDDPAACHELLKLIAATAPVSVEDKAFVQCAAKFLAKPPEFIVSKLGDLEKASVLLRRGRTLRITPDVLSDHLLTQASVSASGATTGYADRVFGTFGKWRPDRVLRNLAELDWRVAQAKGNSTNLLTDIWRSIEAEFADGDWSKRHHVLEILKEAAYFQPEPALRITRTAIRMCAATAKERRTSYWGPQHVLRVIPTVLQRIAFTIEFLSECCDFLWLIGRTDQRALNPFPEHAMRILQDLASYKTNKPPQFNQLILECAIRWLGEPNLHRYAHSPFCIIDKLLEKKGESTSSEGTKVVISPFLVSADKTRVIRGKALDALGNTAQNAPANVAVHALESMRLVLHDNLGMARATPEYLRAWLPEKLRVVEEFGRVVAKRKESILLWKVQQALDWPSQDSPWVEIRTAAGKVMAAVPDTFELRFIRSLMSEPLVPHRRRPPRTDADRYNRMNQDEIERTRFRAAVAKECEDRFRKADYLHHTLNEGLQQLEQAGCNTWPNHLIGAIVSKNPKLGVNLAKAIIRRPNSKVAQHFFVITITLARNLPNSVPSLLEEAAKTKSPRLLFSLAHHFWSSRPEQLPGKREIAVLRGLTQHSDSNAARLAIESLKSLGQRHPGEALKLLVGSKFETHSIKAEAACSCLHKEFGIDPAILSDTQLKHIVARLTSVGDVGDHWIQEFLSYAGARTPLAVVALFIRRISRAAKRPNSEYRPIPFHMRVRFDEFAKHRNAVKTLRQVRDLALKKQWQFPHFAKELFWHVGGVHCIPLLHEWLDSNNAAKITAAGEILENGGPDFVFTNPDFVADALKAAYACGEDCYRSMGAYLRISATSGSKEGTPGHPMPRDVEIQSRAAELIKRFDTDPIVRRLYEALQREAETNMERDRYEYEERFGDD